MALCRNSIELSPSERIEAGLEAEDKATYEGSLATSVTSCVSEPIRLLVVDDSRPFPSAIHFVVIHTITPSNNGPLIMTVKGQQRM